MLKKTIKYVGLKVRLLLIMKKNPNAIFGARFRLDKNTKINIKKNKLIIGENVWIGLNAIILKNTNIGDNSIVAAGSVVKGKFPSNVLIQGNPAKIVRTLEI